MADKQLDTWEAWREVHQPFELDFWVSEGIPAVAEPTFEGWWGRIFDWVEPRGKRLDVGCGARPPFGAGSTAIDPLIDRYKEHTPPEWWEGVEAYSHPAEIPIAELEGTFDTVLCWNCIDHAIGWQWILGNLRAYAKPDAVIAIATDLHDPVIGHPGFRRDEFMAELGKRFEVVRSLDDFAERDLAMVLRCV